MTRTIQNIGDTIRPILGKYEVRYAGIFGSYARGDARPDSDVDILVEFKPMAKIGFFEFVRLQRRLSDFIGKKVDLLTPEAISKFFREKVIKEAELVYGGK